jgi:hypothetical protein
MKRQPRRSFNPNMVSPLNTNMVMCLRCGAATTRAFKNASLDTAGVLPQR